MTFFMLTQTPLSMENFKLYAEEANKAFHTADHLVYVTYPVIHDPKLLTTILEQIHRTLRNGIAALLAFDAAYKRISRFPETHQERLDIFRSVIANRYGLDHELYYVAREIDDLVEKRKQSPMEFSRKDKFVIASRTYRLQALSLQKMKHYIAHTKAFLEKMNGVMRAHDRRFS